MTSFRNQSWGDRFGAMGDEAEMRFEEWAHSTSRGFVRFGLNRPPIAVHRLPPFIRYTPDYLQTNQLVEVQGFGRDQLFKLKADKLEILGQWAEYHPVDLFAWDSTNRRAWMVPLDALQEAAPNMPIGMFDGTKPYYEYSADVLGELGREL